MIDVLVPAGADAERHLQFVKQGSTLPPFDTLVIDFLDAVSKSVLLDSAMSRVPEMAAVAHWMRKAHICELQAAFNERKGNRVWLARGLALHFAPANVDSIFLYSWFLSMLVGNTNIVRLSQRRGPEVGALLEEINLIVEQPRFHAIRSRNVAIAYNHSDEVSEQLSQSCQVRVLWGGDESVRRLRAVPMNPLGLEIVFPSRFSLAVLRADRVCTEEETARRQLVYRFCNDSYWFDQRACSSPRLVVWVGEKQKCELAKGLFWPRVEEEIARRGIQYPEIVGINKLVMGYVSAGQGMVDSIAPNATGSVSRIHLIEDAPADFRSLECGGGLFFETEIPELRSLPALLTEKDQTISYFGFEREEMRELARSIPNRAIDRIVPVGSALNFSAVWDGINLLQTFSREIDLQ